MARVMQRSSDFDHPLKVIFLYASEKELHEKWRGEKKKVQ